MARFYAEIQGNRGAASRMGEASSGMWGHIRGWNIGARVDMDVEDDEDVCHVRVTTGSAGWGNGESLGTFERSPSGAIVWKPSLELVNRVMRAHGRKAVTDVSSVPLYDNTSA